MQKLADALAHAGLPVMTTREPGGTPTGEKIRAVLLDSRSIGIDPMAEMALMFAARAQHIKEVIHPALAAGEIVLCDRFTDSTEAYQGAGRKLGSESVLTLHRILCGNLQPDLTILMDSDPATSIGRARRRNSEELTKSDSDENRFESENTSFFRRVHQGYLAIAARDKNRVALIDARGTPAQTHKKIVPLIKERLKLKLQ